MAKKTKTFLAVEKILGDNQISPMSGVSPRDSDSELLIQYLQFHTDIDLTYDQVVELRKINLESITRARRKLQEKGEYLPSPEVGRRRRLKWYDIQQNAPTDTAADLQLRIEENG